MDEDRGEDMRKLGDSEKVARSLDCMIDCIGLGGVIGLLKLGY